MQLRFAPLALLVSLAAGLLVLLAGAGDPLDPAYASPGGRTLEHPQSASVQSAALRPLPPPRTVRSDTDSVASTGSGDVVAGETSPGTSPPTDSSSVAADSLAIPDSLSAADLDHVLRYVPQRRNRNASVSRLRTPRSPTLLGDPFESRWQQQIDLDSTGSTYVVREMVGEHPARAPLSVDRSTYRQYRLQSDMRENWTEIGDQRARQSGRSQGLGLNLVIPGAQETAFTTIFGAPQVDLQVNGQANINLGFDYSKSDQQVSLTGQQGRLDPNFAQDIQLGITGMIGDKLQVNVDWDTERTFDYENQLKLEYQGYQDDIVQNVVAGNVFLNSSSQLIQSGQSLFGIKSEFQLGGLNFTTVMSQQEGQSNELNISGGSQTTEFSLRPTDYENNTHFFLGYYFHHAWEPAFQDPTQILLDANFQRITDIEVWKLKQSTVEGDNERQVVATVDLGEPESTRQGADAYGERRLPSTELDAYTEADLAHLRDGANNVDTYLQNELGLEPSMYQRGKFRKLQEGSDYEFDDALGYLTLNASLTSNEALAVAFRYQRRDGSIVEVGDFTSGGGSTRQIDADRLVLKLIRTANPEATDPTWDLTLRNIYKIPGRGINQSDFELDVMYAKPGSPSQSTLPGITLPGQQTLLQALGLDRVNTNGAPSPDNAFDFRPGVTIDPGTGRIIFPYLEPFDDRVESLLSDGETQLGGRSLEEAINLLTFPDLYENKIQEAEQNSQLDIYRVEGSYKSSVQETYNLGFNVVPNSVSVTSGGTELTAGEDYVFQQGTVRITNPAYLTPGRDVNITYEQNQMVAIQKKTLLGMRANYEFSDNLNLGATMMKLSEKPVTDKFRVGEEPLNNLIWGMDGRYDEQNVRWLTQAVDALPLVQTRAPSNISIRGEFAQLRPGHAETIALQQTQERLNSQGLSMNPDEQNGVSFIDDFEGIENSYELDRAGSWRLSAPPAESAQTAGVADSTRSNWRGTFGWYQIPRNLYDRIDIRQDNAQAVRPIHVNEVFPERDVSHESIQDLRTFDFYFDPTRRGPYNYTRDLKGMKDSPEEVWGGMVQRLPEGYNDFGVQNVEFVEFIVMPVPRNEGVGSPNAKLYVDLGTISEDVIPNGELNTEDGLSTENIQSAISDPWSQFSSGIQDGVINVDASTRKGEDRGLDGLPSSTEYADYNVTEQTFFDDFLSSVRSQFGENSIEYRRALQDPSADDYHYWSDSEHFDDQDLFPAGPIVQERFAQFYAGTELNSFEGQRVVAGGGRDKVGNSRTPDSEDRNLNANLDTENSYYRYELPLNRNDLDRLAQPGNTNDYVVSKIDADPVNGRSSEWYLVRIPVREFDEKIGNIDGFDFIESMRLWTEGHRQPMTVRFANVELVGSRWEKAEQIGNRQNDDRMSTNLAVSTVNNEENPYYAMPLGAVRAQRRLATGETQEAREQSMSLEVSNLAPSDERAVVKTFREAQNLLKYSNLRMFMHGHGEEGGGFEERGDLHVFVRLGLNRTNDYYQYEQPLTPSDPVANNENPSGMWQTHQQMAGVEGQVDLNSMNIELSALNRLKVERDQTGAAPDSIYQPDREYEFAPPGARLGIKGQPTLSGVQTVVIGVRNPADSTSGKVIHEATVWTNELRVSGYDDDPGWATLASADIKLADLATVSGNMRTQTARFGELSSGLGSRQQTNTQNWALNSTLNLHKLIPEQYGWTLPLSYSIRSNTSTPRYSPNRGDIRLADLEARIEEREDLTPSEMQQEKRELVDRSQTATTTRSISVRADKNGSQSPLLHHTLDALSVNYNRSESKSHSPSTKVNDSWQWSTALNYQLNFQDAHTFQPFGFLDGVWGVGWLLGDLTMSYLPQRINLSTTANRRFNQNQSRPQLNAPIGADPDSLRFEEFSGYPYRENHQLSHRRGVNVQYNPFGFLSLGYQMDVSQSLNTLGTDTTYSVVTRDTLLSDIRRRRAIRQGFVDSASVESRRLQVNPVGQVVNDVLKGTGNIRTEDYAQQYQATFQPNVSQFSALDWIQVQPISYQSSFNWQNGPERQDSVGASVNNSVSIQGNVTFGIQSLWQKFDWYRRLENGGSESAPPDSVDGGLFSGIPGPVDLLRSLALTATSIQDLRISYRTNAQNRSSNVKGGYSLLDAFGGPAPPMAYRIGLDRDLDPRQRWLENGRLQISDTYDTNHQLGAQATLSPTQRFNLDLSSDLSWSTNRDVTYRLNARDAVESTTTEGGSNEVTTWGFVGSYRQFFERQLATYEADVEASPPDGTITDADGDGSVALTNRSLVADFRETFLLSGSTLDQNGFLPFPLPNWNLTYNGLGDLPPFSWIATSATLNHGYSSTYTTDFRTNAAAGLDAQGNPITKQFQVGPRTVRYVVPELEAGAVRINERYQPLIGLSISFLGGVQTNVDWNRSHSLALSPTNADVRSQNTNQISLTVNWSKRGLRLPIPFLGGQELNNTIRFSLNFTRSRNENRRYLLASDLEKVVRDRTDDETFLNPPVQSTVRTSLEPRITYRFSNRVSADAFVRYQHLDNQGSRVPSSTNMSGGFAIRVSISSGGGGSGGGFSPQQRQQQQQMQERYQQQNQGSF